MKQDYKEKKNLVKKNDLTKEYKNGLFCDYIIEV